MIAYEPVWAIGTGRMPGSGIAEMHAHVRPAAGSEGRRGAHPLWRLGQGGQCGPTLAIADVDGALVGGASLKLEEFWTIATWR